MRVGPFIEFFLRPIRPLLPGVIFILYCSVLSAQSPYFRAHPLEEEFLRTSAEIVYEGPSRQLWFGTNKGLFAFDGLEFVQVHLPDTGSKKVSAVLQDPTGVVWVGYDDGRIYTGVPGKLSPWKEGPVIPEGTAITGLVRDSAQHLWIATYGAGIFCWKSGVNLHLSVSNGLPANEIYCLVADGREHIWAGTDGGIVCYNTNEGLPGIRVLGRENGLPDEIIRAMIYDSDGRLWLGTYEQGICQYDPVKDTFLLPEQTWTFGVVSCLSEIPEREIWIGTEGNGLFRYNFETGVYRRIESSDEASVSRIYDLHTDVEGNIWILSSDRGILSANRQFELLFPDDLPALQCNLMDRENRLWLGTESGLFLFHPDSGMVLPSGYPVPDNIISLYEDPYGHLWLGTFGRGLIVWDPDTGRTRHIEESDGLSNGSILSMAGNGPHIWLATLGGASEVDLQQDLLQGAPLVIRNFDHASGLGTNFIYQVFVDSHSRVWFATDGRGICRLTNGKIECFQTAVIDGDSMSFRNVYSITEDHYGTIWFSTPKDGLFSFDGYSFSRLDRKEGIRDLAITGLITDKLGNIIILHPSGIDVLNPADGHFIYFDEAVGIFNFDPTLNGFARSTNGDIWFTDPSLLLRYSPLPGIAIHPRTMIDRVLVSLEQIDAGTSAVFKHNRNQLIFEYSGLWYTDPHAVRFRYKLEGFDVDWIYSRDRQATYSSLPPGNYTFLVSSTENEAFDDEPVSFYSFRILSPVWHRWWFITGGIILLVLGLRWYLHVRDRRQAMISNLERGRLHSELEALKSQINPHFLFNNFNTLITIIEEDPVLAVQYVERLSDFYRSLLQYREQDLIPLDEEIQLVHNYAFLLKKRFGDNLVLNFQASSEGAYLVPMTLQLLLENAVKHNVISTSRPLRIDIVTEDSHVVVRNNLQKKFRPEPSTGFGLSSIKQRYQVLTNRPVQVVSTADFFEVRVPYLKRNGNGVSNGIPAKTTEDL